jgi:hypothetical protein
VHDAEVVGDETCEEGVSLIVAEGVLGFPGSVVFCEPEEVMVPQVYACTDEVRQEWMAFVEHQDVQGHEESGFDDGNECYFEASLLMEAVIRTGASKMFPEECAMRGPSG